jgi:hypothetical protein
MQQLLLKLALIISIPIFAYFVAHDELVRAFGTAMAILLAAFIGIAVATETYINRNKPTANDISTRLILLITGGCWALLAFANLFYFG